jgi:hypothetical protein
MENKPNKDSGAQEWMDYEPKDSEMHNWTTPLVKMTNELIKQGFTDQFVLSEKGLKDSEGEVYQPNQIKILKHYRFEGSSDPADMSILYGVETEDGKKGTIVDAFGTYSDIDLGEFMKDVEELENQNHPK